MKPIKYMIVHRSTSGQTLITIVIVLFFISFLILSTLTKNLINELSIFTKKVDFYKSYYAGISCVEIALSNFKNDINYAGNEQKSIVQNVNCQIKPAITSSTSTVFQIIGVSNDVNRYFLTTLTKSILSKTIQYQLSSVNEVNNF